MKTKLLILPLLIITFFACSSNEKPENEQEMGSIIGKWELFERRTSSPFSNGSYRPVNPELQYFFIFREDNKVETDQYEESCNMGTYIKNNEILIFEFECIGYEFTITNLTATELILETQVDDGKQFFKFKKL